ncbi:RNA-binding transcriptional accessory protein [Pedobacter psychrophilus]|uniref:RNA-binding transcriptional accessory protein n=1 Tax=Pedobacter psychrophilus TaxID=1826909 RepID=A0A179DA69_9SPHI|nr:Tex family protein [Pedobacter psychrophilus]OAQ37946.1 RNA-binding transcriptional accessory protein [Pedobacter psychrophilus]
MAQQHIFLIAQELNLGSKQVETTLNLLDEGATVPFISRYRKEMTGSLDEVQVTNIRDRAQQLRDLDKRKEAILKSIEEQGKLTDELKKAVLAAETMTLLEDIYLPYKQKRKTKASIAKEKGLEPLGLSIINQDQKNPEDEAAAFIDKEKGVNTIEEALQGARDIIAEIISENADTRANLRQLFFNKGVFKAEVLKGKETEGIKYKDYFDWSEPIKTAPSHRVLAMRRGEKELILRLDALPEEDAALQILDKQFITSNNKKAQQVKQALEDSYKRLLKPSMETETRLKSKQMADEEAIKVFAENARQLLLAAPIGQKRVLALDPGFRTGCKLVCLDEQGKLLENTTVYPHTGAGVAKEAAQTLKHLCEKYKIEAIAIGNGTASRETEDFVNAQGLENVLVVMVNESGASIYSASQAARDEFPDYDITVRGAVSIGRRMMDPLAELVKIDPKSIGVGQYQHDVDQNKLQTSLDDTVISCVNAVGVELNTASKQILSYVSGLGPQLAQNIIDYRNLHGAFKNRNSLKKVARLGDKAFEQAAAFLRIRNSENPLDASAVHPERYALVAQMAKDVNCKVADLLTDATKREQIDLRKYISDEVGLPTLKDIIAELAKPGRDPREQFEAFNFADGINKIEDLKPGMRLPGIVTNITNFGAFVDIGVHQDGLVHLSQMADKFISNPNEVVKVSQRVQVTVVEVDTLRKRISLTMKSGEKKEAVQKPVIKTKTQEKEIAKPIQKPVFVNKKEDKAAEGDMQDKLKALMGKFK